MTGKSEGAINSFQKDEKAYAFEVNPSPVRAVQDCDNIAAPYPASHVGEREAELSQALYMFERLLQRFGELWERCQGKGWPEKESDEFHALRDEKLPRLRNMLRTALSAQLQEQKPFGTYVEYSDNTTAFRKSGEAFPPTVQGFTAWTLYTSPQPVPASQDELDAKRWRYVDEHGYPEGLRQIHPTVGEPHWGYDDGPRFSSPAEAVDDASTRDGGAKA